VRGLARQSEDQRRRRLKVSDGGVDEFYLCLSWLMVVVRQL
jgi:hypothetical protein